MSRQPFFIYSIYSRTFRTKAVKNGTRRDETRQPVIRYRSKEGYTQCAHWIIVTSTWFDCQNVCNFYCYCYCVHIAFKLLRVTWKLRQQKLPWSLNILIVKPCKKALWKLLNPNLSLSIRGYHALCNSIQHLSLFWIDCMFCCFFNAYGFL